MPSTPSCPHCHSDKIYTQHLGRKIGGSIGAAAGVGIAALSGVTTGATFAVKHLSDQTPSPQTILSAIIGGLVGGLAGCTAGAAFGDALDQAIFDNYKCIDCDYTFSCVSYHLSKPH